MQKENTKTLNKATNLIKINLKQLNVSYYYPKTNQKEN